MKSEDQPFSFFDNREKYLLFVTTTSEKAITAEHVGREYDCIKPKPPALKIFDAGVGNGMVLSRILCKMHCRFPSVPFFVVGKEISLEDTRLCLEKLAEELSAGNSTKPYSRLANNDQFQESDARTF